MRDIDALRWEAVKYYFAERYHHSAKKYLTAFLTGKNSNSESSNTSQQQWFILFWVDQRVLPIVNLTSVKRLIKRLHITQMQPWGMNPQGGITSVCAIGRSRSQRQKLGGWKLWKDFNIYEIERINLFASNTFILIWCSL